MQFYGILMSEQVNVLIAVKEEQRECSKVGCNDQEIAVPRRHDVQRAV